ncbi:MAG: 50S ribosomal protein L2 [Candidatus Andersenbacteria bacterium]
MAIKTPRVTNNAQRERTVIDYDAVGIHRGNPHKSLAKGHAEKAGRNNLGKITVRHRGNGNKRLLRTVDFAQAKYDVPGIVERVEYDPFRSCFIGLVLYKDGDRRYVPLAEGVLVGSRIVASRGKVDLVAGNRMLLKHIPTGVIISNLELTPGEGARVVRGAGGQASIVAKEGEFANVRLPSGEIRLFSKECAATIGQASNADHGNVRLGKAGRRRWKRQRPTVRGKVMNPVDHPHGGGEGRQPIGLKHPKTPWGKPALGVKTRQRGKPSNRFVIKPRKGRSLPR